MESDRSGFQSRIGIAKSIKDGADILVSSLASFRASLKRGDKAALALDLGDTVAKTVKLFTLTNRDFGSYTSGVSESGIPWLVRVISNMTIDALQRASISQLRQIITVNRRIAETLERVILEEEGGSDAVSDSPAG